MFDGELTDVKESLYSAGGDLSITGKGSVIEASGQACRTNMVDAFEDIKLVS